MRYYTAVLSEGLKHAGPYGHHVAGQPFRITSDERLEYYRSCGRYTITEIEVPESKSDQALSSIGKPCHSGPRSGRLIDVPRLEALSQIRVNNKMSKKRLIDIARDLGCSLDPRTPPSIAALVKMITQQQVVILRALEVKD